MKKAVPIALLSTICFSSTYVINRLISVGDNFSWRWNASLRHYIMFIILGIYLLLSNQMKQTLQVVKKNPGKWILWSTVGFGLFYSFLTYGSYHGESWLTVGVWQTTIIVGVLMTPLFYHEEETPNGIIRVRNKIPKAALGFSCVIFAGVIILQLQQAHTISLEASLRAIIPVTIAAIAYTLGNRKAMVLADGQLTAVQRVFIMSMCSLPFWFILTGTAVASGESPTLKLIGQVALVAVFSGCIGTTLYFKATDMVKDDPKKLAVVESTVATEILTTLLISVAIGVSDWPDFWGFVGLGIIIVGMLANSFFGARSKNESK